MGHSTRNRIKFGTEDYLISSGSQKSSFTREETKRSVGRHATTNQRRRRGEILEMFPIYVDRPMYLVLITMRYYIMYPVFALATHSDVFAFSYSGRELAIYQIKRSPSIFWVRLRSEFRECFSIPPLSFSAIYQVGLAHSKAINKLLQRMLRDRHGQ